MPKTIFVYEGEGKNGGYIKTKLFDKSKKKRCKDDVVRFEMLSSRYIKPFKFDCTIKEAIIIANGLLLAVTKNYEDEWRKENNKGMKENAFDKWEKGKPFIKAIKKSKD